MSLPPDLPIRVAVLETQFEHLIAAVDAIRENTDRVASAVANHARFEERQAGQSDAIRRLFAACEKLEKQTSELATEVHQLRDGAQAGAKLLGWAERGAWAAVVALLGVAGKWFKM